MLCVATPKRLGMIISQQQWSCDSVCEGQTLLASQPQGPCTFCAGPLHTTVLSKGLSFELMACLKPKI